MKKRGPYFQKVFDFCYNYKQRWTRSGRKTPIIDAVVFNKVSESMIRVNDALGYDKNLNLGGCIIILLIFSFKFLIFRSGLFSEEKWNS